MTEAVGLFMEYARREGLWLACDCAGDDNGTMPLLAPCRRGETVYWRTLPRSAERHAPDCVFHDTARIRRTVLTDLQRGARVAPAGNFEILRKTSKETRASSGQSRSAGSDGKGGTRTPALSQQLLRLVDKAQLNRLKSEDGFAHKENWREILFESTKGIMIAPNQPLHDLWFYSMRRWNNESVHASVRAAAKNWPKGHVPQGFLCVTVDRVDGKEVYDEGQ